MDGKISVAIAEVNVRIENEIKAINASISAIETRLQKLEGDIATISEQVANINSTIENLQSTSEELDDYIESLQATAKTLQEMIEASDAEIDEVEARLKGETEDVRNEILRQLASLKANTEAELDRINGLIAALQVKDAELDGKITSLQSYVESELASNRDWVEATIATLEQYGSLASDIAAIKAQMQAVNERIDWLDNTLTNKINDQLSTILSVCSGEIQSSVTKVTEEYTQAIDKAKEDITAAYKAEIRNAFYALEASMKQWVNECLQQYYTISEVEGKLAALRAEFANADNEILDEIEALQKSYDASKQEMVGIIYNIVEQTIDTNNGIIDDRIDEAIVRITDNIQNQIDAIAEQIAQIESRLNTIESDLANVKGQIWAILDSIEKLEDTYDQLDGYVSHLSSVAGELQQSLGQIDSRIDEVETSLGGEISSAKAELKAQLNALRESIVSQLEQIGQTVEMLQAKEDQLAVRISDLQTYVDTELADNKDWANATFATLEHQNFLANEVASIKAQIDAINQGMTALYARMEEKINNEISAVTASLSSTIQSKVDDVTSAYSAAILTAKEQITAAYTAEIQNAFYALESSLMGWVSQQLSGYYTISQVESLLASMSNEFNN